MRHCLGDSAGPVIKSGMTRKRKCVIMAGVDDDGPIRTSWFGMGGRPQLPYSFPSKRGKRPRQPARLRPQRGPRLKSLDEFEAPAWKGRMRWRGDDRVTLGGIVGDTVCWLAVFAIGGTFVWTWWTWGDGDACVRIGSFTLGWC